MSVPDGLRRAAAGDLVALHDLERAASLRAHRDVFPPDRYPFPSGDVLARWSLVLADPQVTVEVLGPPPEVGGPGLLGLVAYDTGSLRHLAVHPDCWGRGTATRLLGHVLARQRERGAREVSLWVLDANSRARALYERHGWRLSGERQESPWPPYPAELGYRRVLDDGQTDRTGEEASG